MFYIFAILQTSGMTLLWYNLGVVQELQLQRCATEVRRKVQQRHSYGMVSNI